MSTQIKMQLEKERARMIQKHGAKSVALGSEKYVMNVVPTKSRMLNYMLGIGGLPYGHMVEVFGANQIGKTSALGYGVVSNVQAQHKVPGIIAMEPMFDIDWAATHGVDPDLVIIARPDNAEEAFEIMHDWVFGGLIDYVLFDSIGAAGSKSDVEDGSKKKAYGNSGVVTAGLNAIMPRAFKNNVGIMLINQQRQTGVFNGTTLYDSPGGEGLKHHAMIRIHLKPGRNKYTAEIDGEKILVGRELIAAFKKNKLAQATNKTARFDYYHIASPLNPVGVDVAADVINTAKLTNVFESTGAWLHHHTFPDGKLNGKSAVGKFLAEHPEVLEIIESELTNKMLQSELDAAATNRAKKLKVVDGG